MTIQFARAVACVLCLVTAALGQETSEPFVRVWHSEDGLPSDTVSAICQTPDGFLWVGTYRGLARFDGVHFKSFGKAEGLPTTVISLLVADREGSLWVQASGAGLIRVRNGVASYIRVTDGLPSEDVSDMVVDRDGTLWVATRRGVASWDGTRFKALPPALDAWGEDSAVAALLARRSGELWTVSAKGSCAIWKDGAWEKDPPQVPPGFGTTKYLAEDGGGQVWAVTASGTVARLETNGWSEVPIDPRPTDPAPTPIIVDPSGAALVSFGSGETWNLSEARLLAIRPGVAHMFCDRAGQLWIGTFSNGLERISSRHVENIVLDPKGTDRNSIRGILEVSPGVFWFGTEGAGLWCWKNGRADRVDLGPSLMVGYVDAILRAHDGSVYLGTEGGVIRYGEGGKSFRLALQGFEAGDYIQALAEDGSGAIWAGSGGGKLYKIIDDHADLANSNARDGSIRDILPMPDGALWLATYSNGVRRIRNGQSTSFKEPEGLRTSSVYTLAADSSGTLWAGTDGGGLARWRDGKFQSVGTEAGLADDTITQLLGDSSGNLWMAGPRGLAVASLQQLNAVFDGSSPQVNPRLIGRMDGIVSTDFLDMRPIRDSRGRLCFGTRGGVVCVEPGILAIPREDMRVFFEHVSVNGQRLKAPPGGLWPASLDLGVGAAQVEIAFTAPELFSPDHVRFRWRLAGLDGQWHDTEGAREVTLSRVPPGHYRFEVAATRGDGLGTAPAALALVLRPHYWQTWWFLAGCILAAVLAVGAIVNEVVSRRAERKLAKVERLRAVEAERTRIARDLHDEIGSNLAALAVLSAGAVKGAKSQDQPHQKWDLANRIAIETTNSMREVLWLMGERADSGLSMGGHFQLVANRMLSGIEVCWRERAEEFPASLSREARHQVFLFFKEALANIIRHAEAHKVELATSIQDGEFHLVVADDGRGFDPALVNAGVGLKSLAARAVTIGGTMDIESAPGAGVTVHLRVPVGTKR